MLIKYPNKEKNGRRKTYKKNKRFNTEISSEFSSEDFDKISVNFRRNHRYREKNENSIQTLPSSIKALLITSWICAALAAFVSFYFSILGVLTAYIANKEMPGIGRTAMITNITLALINIILSILFLSTVRNIFTLF